MTDANEDRLYVEGIKTRCSPAKMNEQTMMVLTAMVENQTGVREQSAASELTRKLVAQAYQGLAGRHMDDRCFESDRHFMRALVLETMARAQEYSIDMHTERRLPPRDGEERAR